MHAAHTCVYLSPVLVKHWRVPADAGRRAAAEARELLSAVAALANT